MKNRTDGLTDLLTDGSKTLYPPQLVAWGINIKFRDKSPRYQKPIGHIAHLNALPILHEINTFPVNRDGAKGKKRQYWKSKIPGTNIFQLKFTYKSLLAMNTLLPSGFKEDFENSPK